MNLAKRRVQNRLPPFDKLRARHNLYFFVVLGFLTGFLVVFVLPALPVPAVGFFTAGFLVVPVGFVVDGVEGLAAGLLVGLAAGLAVVTGLVFFAEIVEAFTVGLAAFLSTDAGLEAAVFSFTTTALDAFLAGAFATVFVFTVAAFALVFVFAAAVFVVLTARSPFACSAVVF